MKILIMLALLMPMYVHADAAQMNERDFTNNILERLKAGIPESEFEIVGELKIIAQSQSGYELTLFLDNAYDVYRSGIRDIELVYDDQVATLKSHESALSNNDIRSILPVSKPRAYLDKARQQLEEAGYDKEGLPFYFDKINDDIYQMYVFDSQDSMRFVTPEDVEKYDIGGSISSIASRNMELYYARVGAQLVELDTGGNGQIYHFSADENYESSILASFGYLERIGLDSSEDWVVFVPARNIALVVGAGDSAAVELASRLAFDGYYELGYAISPYGYIKKNRSWVRFRQ